MMLRIADLTLTARRSTPGEWLLSAYSDLQFLRWEPPQLTQSGPNV